MVMISVGKFRRSLNTKGEKRGSCGADWRTHGEAVIGKKASIDSCDRSGATYLPDWLSH